MTDATLSAVAARLDELKRLADHFERLGMVGLARTLRELAATVEDAATGPHPGG